jgi:hypothetical protein
MFTTGFNDQANCEDNLNGLYGSNITITINLNTRVNGININVHVSWG